MISTENNINNIINNDHKNTLIEENRRLKIIEKKMKEIEDKIINLPNNEFAKHINRERPNIEILDILQYLNKLNCAKKTELFKISDEDISYYKKYIYTHGILNKTHPCFNNEKIKKETITKNCLICWDDYMEDQLITCKNNHYICIKCFETQLTSYCINDDKSNLEEVIKFKKKCFDINCNECFTNEQILDFCKNEEIRKKWFDTITFLTKRNSKIEASEKIYKTFSKDMKHLENELRKQELIKACPHAKQCTKCNYGPILQKNCDNLLTHSREANNSCPGCGIQFINWKDKKELRSWDGSLPEETRCFDRIKKINEKIIIDKKSNMINKFNCYYYVKVTVQCSIPSDYSSYGSSSSSSSSVRFVKVIAKFGLHGNKYQFDILKNGNIRIIVQGGSHDIILYKESDFLKNILHPIGKTNHIEIKEKDYLSTSSPFIKWKYIKHSGSWSGCGGNYNGIPDTQSSGNCSSNCYNCGAGTHWTCCGSPHNEEPFCSFGMTLKVATKNASECKEKNPTYKKKFITSYCDGKTCKITHNKDDICKVCNLRWGQHLKHRCPLDESLSNQYTYDSLASFPIKKEMDIIDLCISKKTKEINYSKPNSVKNKTEYFKNLKFIDVGAVYPYQDVKQRTPSSKSIFDYNLLDEYKQKQFYILPPNKEEFLFLDSVNNLIFKKFNIYKIENTSELNKRLKIAFTNVEINHTPKLSTINIKSILSESNWDDFKKSASRKLFINDFNKKIYRVIIAHVFRKNNSNGWDRVGIMSSEQTYITQIKNYKENDIIVCFDEYTLPGGKSLETKRKLKVNALKKNFEDLKKLGNSIQYTNEIRKIIPASYVSSSANSSTNATMRGNINIQPYANSNEKIYIKKYKYNKQEIISTFKELFKYNRVGERMVPNCYINMAYLNKYLEGAKFNEHINHFINFIKDCYKNRHISISEYIFTSTASTILEKYCRILGFHNYGAGKAGHIDRLYRLINQNIEKLKPLEIIPKNKKKRKKITSKEIIEIEKPKKSKKPKNVYNNPFLDI
jgi:hypothetical protein